MDKSLAKEIIEGLMRLTPPFNDLTELSMRLPKDEGVAMRRELAPILNQIDAIMRPILKEYPDLDPYAGK